MRRCLTSLFVAALLLAGAFTAKAAEGPPFSAVLTAGEGRGGSSFDLTLSYGGEAGPLGAFVLWLDFDPARFTCQRVRLSDSLQDNYTTTAGPEEGQEALVYTQKSTGLAYAGPRTAVTYRFQVREDAEPGPAEFRVRVGQALSSEGEGVFPDIEEVLSFEVLEPISSDCALISLAPDAGELDQPFSSDQLFYTMSVPYSVSSLTFTAVPVEGATYRVNRQRLLGEGSTTEFQLTVTAADGKTKQVYQVDVYREPRSDNAELLSLVPDTGELDQEFSPSRLEYTMSVPAEVGTLSFTYEPAEGAKCTVNAKKLGNPGTETEFRFTVTAEDGKAKQIYRVTVYREALRDEALLRSLVPNVGGFEQEFSPGRLHYTMRVPYEVEEVSFTAVPVDGATCKVDAKRLGSGGSTTTFKITVTAEDGKTKQVYEVEVYREKEQLSQDAALLSLEPDTGSLDPAFSPDVLDYAMTVPYSVTSLTFQATAAEGASWKVNRKNLGAGGSDTEFLFTVTAEDKETKQVYRVMVHREEKVKATASPSASTNTSASNSIASSTKAAAAATKTPSPTSTPRPSASPSPSPSPSGIPVPVVEDEEESEPPVLQINGLPEGSASEEGASPFLYVMFAGMGVAAVFLSGPVSRWLEVRKKK